MGVIANVLIGFLTISGVVLFFIFLEEILRIIFPVAALCALLIVCGQVGACTLRGFQ